MPLAPTALGRWSRQVRKKGGTEAPPLVSSRLAAGELANYLAITLREWTLVF